MNKAEDLVRIVVECEFNKIVTNGRFEKVVRSILNNEFERIRSELLNRIYTSDNSNSDINAVGHIHTIVGRDLINILTALLESRTAKENIDVDN